jgi:hypothetical protein
VREFLQSFKDLNLTTGQTVVIVLFLLTWLECLVAWVFGLFEQAAIRRLSGKFFGLGFILWRRTLNAPAPPFAGTTVLRLSLAQLRVLEPDRLIFSSLGRRESGGRVLASLKGEARWVGDTAEITVRTPFASTYFMIAWLSVCVIWAIMGIMFSIPLTTLVIPVAMLIGGSLMLRHTWKRARQDSELVAAEITQHLGAKTR